MNNSIFFSFEKVVPVEMIWDGRTFFSLLFCFLLLKFFSSFFSFFLVSFSRLVAGGSKRVFFFFQVLQHWVVPETTDSRMEARQRSQFATLFFSFFLFLWVGVCEGARERGREGSQSRWHVGCCLLARLRTELWYHKGRKK